MKQTSRKKVLVSSAAMLMVATVSLGSATYAWFTNTTTAKANNAKVTVSAPSGLKIAAVKAGEAAPKLTAYKSTFDLTSLAQGSLTPASGNVTDTSGISFLEATVDADKNVTKIATSSSYIAVDIYGILSTPSDTAKKVNLTSISHAVHSVSAGDVVRCAYYDGNTKKAYVNFGTAERSVNPLDKEAATITGITTNDNFVLEKKQTGEDYVAADAISAVASSTVSNVSVPAVSYVNEAANATKIGTVYLWVEGQDISCNNANVDSVVGSTGDITFNYALVE